MGRTRDSLLLDSASKYSSSHQTQRDKHLGKTNRTGFLGFLNFHFTECFKIIVCLLQGWRQRAQQDTGDSPARYFITYTDV